MEKNRCEECQKDFTSKEALDQHNRDKHGIGIKSRHELKQLKKEEREKQQDLEKKAVERRNLLKKAIYIIIPIAVIGLAYAFLSLQETPTNNAIDNSDIPNYPIHWHPKLEIIIKGQQQTIPPNLGLTGAAHQPIHTHDSTGVLHYENNRPTFENMRLGYFFEKVWRKTFKSTCILNYCNGDEGTVKMFVNNLENNEFENYIPKDADEITIEFS